MTIQELVEVGKTYDLESYKERKAFASFLISNGFELRYGKDYYTIESMCNELDIYYHQLNDCGEMVVSEKHFIDTYGEDGKAYVEVYDKCLELHLDHHYFDGFNQRHNQYASFYSRKFSSMYSFSTFNSGGYNQSVLLFDFYSFGHPSNYEKYVKIEELGVKGICIITSLLKEKVQSVIEYRERNKWQGELKLDEYAEKLQESHPDLTIYVCEGKRGCDGNCEPYKAIVINEGRAQLGTITMGIGFDGVASITKRVPLCGESTTKTTNDNVMIDLEKCIKFITS